MRIQSSSAMPNGCSSENKVEQDCAKGARCGSLSIFYLSYQLTVNGLVIGDPEMFSAETNSAQVYCYIAKNYCREHLKYIFSIAMSTFLVSLVFTTDVLKEKQDDVQV